VGLFIPLALGASIIVPTLDDVAIPLTEIQIVGSRYVYSCDETEITAEEYASFALPDAPPVKCPAYETHKFNTPDGKIHDNEYYLDDGRKYVKLPDYDVFSLDKSNLRGGNFKKDILTITNKASFEEYVKD